MRVKQGRGEGGKGTLIKKKMKFSSSMQAVAKSYMRKGFQMYEEMRKYLITYEEAFSQI